MTLKYYLRGLGMGIVITDLILSVSHCTQRKISKEEIIKRAEALGMVMPSDEDIFNTEDGTTSQDATEPSTEEMTTENPTTEVPTTEAPTTEAPTEAPTTEASTEEPTTEEPTEEPTTEEPTTEEPTTAEPSVVELTFTVERGMYSEAVTRILVQGGIITNEAEFNQYLSDTGYDYMIQTGVFTVNSGMSYEEIAKIISKTY